MNEFSEVFQRLCAALPHSNLSIRVDHANFETVYIHRGDDGSFVVSDHNETWDYLEYGSDNYLLPSEVGPQINEICARRGVELADLNADEEDLPPKMTLLKQARTDQEVRQAIEDVAACIDRIFDCALKR